MGKFLTLLLVGAGAYYFWRNRTTLHCPACDREVREGAQTCRYCGEVIQDGPTIDVDAR